MRPRSNDLRNRVVAAMETGGSCRAVASHAEQLGVTGSSPGQLTARVFAKSGAFRSR